MPGCDPLHPEANEPAPRISKVLNIALIRPQAKCTDLSDMCFLILQQPQFRNFMPLTSKKPSLALHGESAAWS